MLKAPVEAFCKIEWRLKLIAFYISPGRNLNNKLKKILFGKFFFLLLKNFMSQKRYFPLISCKILIMVKIRHCVV